MFIATCNNLENIPGPLKDRMEVITLSGYTQEEKIAISKKYLIPKQLKENGISENHVEFSEDSLPARQKSLPAFRYGMFQGLAGLACPADGLGGALRHE